MPGMKDIATKVNAYNINMIVVMLIIMQTFMYTCKFVAGFSIAKLYCICQNV